MGSLGLFIALSYSRPYRLICEKCNLHQNPQNLKNSPTQSFCSALYAKEAYYTSSLPSPLLRCSARDSPEIIWMTQIAKIFLNLIAALWPNTLSSLEGSLVPSVHWQKSNNSYSFIALSSRPGLQRKSFWFEWGLQL